MHKKHHAKIKELIKSYSKTLLEDCEKLLKSGMIDPEEFDQEEYALAKIILTAAIERTQDCYKPMFSYRKTKLKT
jgi:hypothetical protein